MHNSVELIFNPSQMVKIADEVGAYKARKNQWLSFISAITAGAFIALAFVFYTTTQTTSVTPSGIVNEAPWGLAKLVGGLVFTLGLIMVVVCGAELFTSSTMTIVARLTGKITTFQMLLNWGVVYIGNFIGGLIVVALIWFSGQIMTNNGNWGLTILNTANHKIHHSFIEAFCLGILCNIMVCIAVWMSYAGKSLTDKILVMLLPIGMFVASGFEHCVANMFMIPMGIVVKNFADVDFWTAIGYHSNQFGDLDLYHFLIKNLLPVTLGNIIGGVVCVASVQYYLNKPHH